MSVDLENLRRRLVLRHKPGGRCVYDKAAKAEFVELCLQPGVSVARLAREFGINANQVARWIRDHGPLRKRASVVASTPEASPFVAVPVLTAQVPPVVDELDVGHDVGLQATLPNGVRVELRGVRLRQLADVLQTLGRLTCSVSTSV
ncbi:IS66-like element accessory protein TnpA [Roseateles cellulosilyticus]|uniref:Transposase n=1 Tax=Pelomonas cellulosilytica TaxID=2906762 RepID=A0ABS8Y0V8_9BURK|nr:transposase [Pelomonas sp. P8]MCE4557200.1 transposase [Pelomonas sp. P8]